MWLWVDRSEEDLGGVERENLDQNTFYEKDYFQ